MCPSPFFMMTCPSKDDILCGRLLSRMFLFTPFFLFFRSKIYNTVLDHSPQQTIYNK